jgi:hypothetical protein
MNYTREMNLARHQLFLDEEGITEQRNLKKTMHQPLKKGAVIRPDLITGGCLQIRCAPAWDPNEKLFKILMIGDGGTSYAESVDGVQWTTPHLYQKMIEGSLENNYVTIDPSLEWPQNGILNMIYDPDEKDDSRRFKALGFNPDPNLRVLNFDKQPLVSPDCKKWSILKVPKLIRSQDESNLSYDSITHTYVATVKLSGSFGRAVYVSTSKDFENWTEPELVFSADELDQKLGMKNIEQRLNDPRYKPMFYNIPDTYNVDVYNMGIFRYEDYYIGLPTLYHQTGKVPPNWEGFDDLYNTQSKQKMSAFRESGDWGGFHHIQLASTRDLKNWVRIGERKPFIDCSPIDAGAYDLSTVIGVSAPVYMGDELWFYYTGIKRYGGLEYEKDNGAICLATLRSDGFVSLDAGSDEGYLMTDPFIFPKGDLHFNINAIRGSAVVTICDEKGKEIPNFNKSKPVKGDFCDTKVEWDGNDSSLLVGKKIRLSMKFNQSQFYSWWIS